MIMTMRSAAAAALLLGSVVAAQPAAAQGLFFDWGFSQQAGGSGKEYVSFRGGTPGEMIVSFSDRKLSYVLGGGQAIAYPIASPREQSRWSGVTNVSQKRENPSWTPTPSMRAENPRLPTWVPGGHPMNPLGVRALYLGSSMYRIHGTDAPWTIGTAASKGCIRMYNQDVLDLYPRVRVGARVTVTWYKYQTGPAMAAASSSLFGSDAAERPRRPVPKATSRAAPRKATPSGAGE
jgi:lipoprotein-anchoring transpeptidase ErfK/SrfK